MDGPFTIEQAQCIYGGHFWTCPLGLVDKPGSLDLRMIRQFSKDDQFGHSTNSWIDSNDFPMCWFMAATIASFVSVLSFLWPLYAVLNHAHSWHSMFYFFPWCFMYRLWSSMGLNVFLHASFLSQGNLDQVVACV